VKINNLDTCCEQVDRRGKNYETIPLLVYERNFNNALLKKLYHKQQGGIRK
jgi:hypothetical protein